MKILGINVGHDSGVCLIESGKIIAAINEERLSRIKMHTGFPERAINEVLSIANLKPHEIHAVAVEGKTLSPQPDAGYDADSCRWTKKVAMQLGLEEFLLGTELGLNVVRKSFLPKLTADHLKLHHYFRSLGFSGKFVAFDHHECHAASAYYTQGENEGIALTLDASGEGYCSRIFLCQGNKMELVHTIPCFHSPAYYYSSITKILGFVPMRHEGKVTGLAAFGKPEKVIEVLKGFLSFDESNLSFVNSGGYYITAIPKLAASLRSFSKEDIAAGIQTYCEQLLCAYTRAVIKKWAPKTPVPLFLAGGLFANVRINQKIQELSEVKSVYICPNMGDGGLNLGAALLFGFKEGGFKERFDTHSLYWGRPFDNESIEFDLQRSGVSYHKSQQVAKDVANLIVSGKVAGRFQGAMEYGPRALGNRSILYSATDPQVNQWLNQRLKRTEFMPFAPYVREVDAAEYFHLADEIRPYRFMTMTCEVTPKCRREAPGIVHVDGTARPPIVFRKDNPVYYDILSEYRKLTGIGVLVNTSFNMHEEPIVNTPEEAIRTFQSGKLDVLSIGDFIVEKGA